MFEYEINVARKEDSNRNFRVGNCIQFLIRRAFVGLVERKKVFQLNFVGIDP